MPPLNAASTSAMQSVLENVAAAGGVGAAGLAGQLRSAVAEMAGGEQDELMRAIAMSLGENVTVSSGENPNDNAEAKREEQEEEERFAKEDFEALEKGVIDKFTENILSGCLGLLDTLSDTVYRVCDLLLAVFARNGDEFKERVIRALILEVKSSLSALTARGSVAEDGPLVVLAALCSSGDAARASARIHLFTLLFEDCSILCAKIVDESRAVADMTRLMTTMQEVMKKAKQEHGSSASIVTPRWMTPMLLFIDLHEKIILGMNRRARLASVSYSLLNSCLLEFRSFTVNELCLSAVLKCQTQNPNNVNKNHLFPYIIDMLAYMEVV